VKAPRLGRIAGCLAIGLLVAACSKRGSVAADAGAEAGAAVADGKALVKGACLSCHSEHMLRQQRLTQAQWQKTVVKMVGWGANLEPAEIAPLVAYLASSYGSDAGPYEAETISATDAIAELTPLPEEPFPQGDTERGKALFAARCSACHGADARGQIGVTLVERPFLYRAADFARTVRLGRGKMLPTPLNDAEIGDVLAHLRTLRNPPPP
jgi:mono/diheme cytochrome c family protein